MILLVIKLFFNLFYTDYDITWQFYINKMIFLIHFLEKIIKFLLGDFFLNYTFTNIKIIKLYLKIFFKYNKE